MLPLETATDAQPASQHPKTRISTNCDHFFSKPSQNSLENGPKQGLEWSDGAETLSIPSTIEGNNWAKSEGDLSTLSRRTKDFQCIFRPFLVNGDHQKNVVPHFRGLDLGAQVEFLHGIFFIPLVQSEFCQEITKARSQDQYPCTGALCRSYSPPRVLCSITQFTFRFFFHRF